MKKLALSAAVAAFLFVSPSFAAIPQSERDALMALYNATGGAQWSPMSGWGGPAGTECDWSDVYCDDAKTTVIQLYLVARNLNGTLPPQLGDLTNIQQLRLGNNLIRGTIPPELGKLAKLQILEINNNQLTGAIPAELGNLSQLQVLNLSDNNLSGALPPQLTNLSKLTYLDLAYCRGLSGALPEVSNWTGLTHLALSDNQFTGAIPASIGRLVNLEQLAIDTNRLTGGIPPQIGNLTKLTVLNLSVNLQLGGTIPREIGNLTNLTQLLLAYDGLTGTIPDEVYSSRQLAILSLAGNQLSGSISPKIGNLTALTQVDLNTNQLSGPIPAEINNLSALTELNLQENALTGTIPPKLDGLTSLVTFDLGANKLTGGIPSTIGSLTKLENLALYQNDLGGPIPDFLRNVPNLTNINLEADNLTGPLPDWIFQFPKLDTLYLGYNALSGPLPSNVSSATGLEILDLAENQITGSLPSDFGKLQKLQNVNFSRNALAGPIPDSFWSIPTLFFVDLGSNQFSGPLSPAIRNQRLRTLYLHDNRLSGVLPPEIGTLSNLDLLDIGSNEFTGTLPRELGQLKKLEAVDFSANNFRSPVPPEIAGMTAVVDGGADFAYNALTVTDPATVTFMNRVQFDHDFAKSQTVTPANITVDHVTDRSAVVNWKPIPYYWDEGGYRVFASLTPNGAPVAVATSASKEIESVTVRGLQPSTTYYFTVATVSHPHDFQHNLVVSDSSAPVSATTSARQLAPADVVVTATPTGLVELDGVAQNQDSFTLTNFGDAPTSITLDLFDNNFFDVDPKQFTLAGGASQTVKVTALPNVPAGFYYGGVVPRGNGTSDDDTVTVTMLSAKRAGGVAIAEPATNRIEISTAQGVPPVGQVTFRNKGTATLVGVLVSDQPWLVPNNAPITIEPGTAAIVGFRIIRARRPPGVVSGALTGTLSLIYVGELPAGVSGGQAPSSVTASDTTPVSISKVTVVDISKPEVGNASAPGLSSGEVAYFAAGLLNRGDLSSSLASALTIVNAFGATPVNDVRLYYTSASQKAVATLSALGSAQGVALANVVSNVYSPTDQIGTVQVRSGDWQNLVVSATFLRSTGAGTLLGDMPVFRSDRALGAKDKLYLTGIAQSSTVQAALVLSEIAGTAATAGLDFVDSAGTIVQHRDVQIAASSTVELTDVPATTSTIVVTNGSTSPTGVLAYVRMSDNRSGDTWSIVDWSRTYRYRRSEAVRVPVVSGGSSGGGKRRAVKQSEAVRATTSAALFNSGSAEARAKIGSKDVTIPARQTLAIADLGAFVGAKESQSVVITPKSGEIVVTSRTSIGPIGTAVPVVPAASGLRVGQSQVFSGLEDSGAYRTDYGFVETGGASTTIRATLLLSDARSLFTTVVSRDFKLDPGAFVQVNELVKSILGPTRSTYGDLHNLQLQLEVVDGSGSILPFVTITDAQTGDTILRLE